MSEPKTFQERFAARHAERQERIERRARELEARERRLAERGFEAVSGKRRRWNMAIWELFRG